MWTLYLTFCKLLLGKSFMNKQALNNRSGKGMSIPEFMKLKVNGLLSQVHVYLNLNSTTLHDLRENSLSLCVWIACLQNWGNITYFKNCNEY